MPPTRPATAQHNSASGKQRINLGNLLGACIDAAERSCKVIRQVQSAREAGKPIGESYKDVSDPRSALTIADTMAQLAIVTPLSEQFPGLKIVSEEDDDAEASDNDTMHPALRTECEGIEMPDHLKSVSIDDLCLFCDPLDGTLEFVEGRLESVQTLIGISLRGEPIAGVIGQPFVSENIIYGVVGAGVVNLPIEPASNQDRRGLVLASSHSRVKPMIKEATHIINPESVLPLGGAGNKMIQVAKGTADICILNLATSLWDTAATSAIIVATGGIVTDLFGNPIRHFADSRISNRYGVLVSGKQLTENDVQGRNHQGICKQLRVSMVLDPLLTDTGLLSEGKPQATNIALDIEGQPISTEWLSEVLGYKVSGFSADETSAVRYLMSDACRVRLWYEEGSPSGPRSVFLKRMVMQDLEHVKLKARTAPLKLLRDVTSYQVEAGFLSCSAIGEFCEKGARIPKPFHVDARPTSANGPPIESKFFLLLEDFSPEAGWGQQGLLGKEELLAALESLASLHAFFWAYTSDVKYDELCEAVWDQATYWVPKRQAKDLFEKLPACWEDHRRNFASELGELESDMDGTVGLEDVGRVLGECAVGIARRVHDVGLDVENKHRTIIHGDAKGANFFFKGSSGNNENESEGLDVGMIDFQWCGWGHPAVDVSYLMASSASPELLTKDGSSERGFLRMYYEYLCSYFVKYGKADSVIAAERLISFEDLTEFYNESFLDLARIVISYHWARIGANAKVLESRRDNIGSNSYNKNIDCAMWFVYRTAALLGEREKCKLFSS